MKSKAELRKEFRKRLTTPAESSEKPNGQSQAVAQLNSQIATLLKEESGVWAAYQPVGFEPDIQPAVAKLTQIQWAYPRVEGSDLAFYIPEKNVHLTLNRFGILEPDPQHSSSVSLNDLKGLLIPGLAFDSNCNRLGRGAGFYDRALAKSKDQKRAKYIGVALECQIWDQELPTDSFDVPMDLVVTERCAYQRGVGQVDITSSALSERNPS